MDRLQARGKAQAVFNFIKVLATTEPVETDKDWWALRMFSVRN